MAERVQPPPDPSSEDAEPPSNDVDAQHCLRSGNYIIQFPKDQIYRVPPPENAHLAERFLKTPPRTSIFSRPCIKWLLLILLILIILICILILLFYTILRPHPPTFHIKHIAINTPHSPSHHHHHHHTTPQYHISFIVKNTNAQLGLLYQKGGTATLAYRGHKIATGKPPSFSQPQSNSTAYPLLLAGLDMELPRDIQKSFKGSRKGVHLSLSLTVPFRIRVGAISLWDKNLDVGCNLTVNSLAKGTSITSQECHSKIKA